jgi:hypothetical protein
MSDHERRRKTPLERAQERAAREAEQYAREQEEYRRNGEDQEEFREMMYLAGRTNSRRRERE